MTQSRAFKNKSFITAYCFCSFSLATFCCNRQQLILEDTEGFATSPDKNKNCPRQIKGYKVLTHQNVSINNYRETYIARQFWSKNKILPRKVCSEESLSFKF